MEEKKEMKKGKLKKFLAMFSSFAIGCSTLFMLTGCPDPVPVPDFNYTIGSEDSDRLEYETDGAAVRLKLYPIEYYVDNFYVNYIENVTDDVIYEKDVDYEIDTGNVSSFGRYEVKFLANHTKTCTYVIYCSSSENTKAKDCLKKTFKIIVDGAEEYETPKITTQPVSATYYYKESSSGPYYSDKECTKSVTIAALTVVAEISKGEMNYQWYKDASAIVDATVSSYTPTAAGSYYVVVSNKDHAASCVTSNTAKVVLSNANNPTPEITTDIASTSYDKIGEAATLAVVATVDASVTPDLHYQWYKDGVVIDGSTASSYKPTAFGSYYVEIWNVFNSEESEHITSSVAVISEKAAKLKPITPSEATRVSYDATNGNELEVSFSCNIDVDEISYQWYFVEGEQASSENSEIIPGATTTKYTATEPGTYFCKASVVSKYDSSNTCIMESYHYYVVEEELEGTGSIGFDFN